MAMDSGFSTIAGFDLLAGAGLVDAAPDSTHVLPTKFISVIARNKRVCSILKFASNHLLDSDS